MADLHLVEEELADGRLVAPFQPVLRGELLTAWVQRAEREPGASRPRP